MQAISVKEEPFATAKQNQTLGIKVGTGRTTSSSFSQSHKKMNTIAGKEELLATTMRKQNLEMKVGTGGTTSSSLSQSQKKQNMPPKPKLKKLSDIADPAPITPSFQGGPTQPSPSRQPSSTAPLKTCPPRQSQTPITPSFQERPPEPSPSRKPSSAPPHKICPPRQTQHSVPPSLQTQPTRPASQLKSHLTPLVHTHPFSKAQPYSLPFPTYPFPEPSTFTSAHDTTDASPHVARSIRCSFLPNVDEDEIEGPAKKRKRGVVTGKKTLRKFQEEGLIKVTSSDLHNGPKSKEIRSLLSHEIGYYVKDEVPMLGPSLAEIEKEYKNTRGAAEKYLEAHFLLPKEDTILWNFIRKIAVGRFRDWKYDCRSHWEQFGDEIPLEFLERPEEWEWLCNHFKDPKQQELSERMKWVRAQKKLNHRSGKLAFSHRAEQHLLKRNPTPFVQAYIDAYSAIPEAQPYVDKMNEMVNLKLEERLAEHPDIPYDEPLDIPTQVDIIVAVVGERSGTEIRGVGGCMRRAPHKKGGSRHIHDATHLEEKLAVQGEKLAAQEEENRDLHVRLSFLEESFALYFGGPSPGRQ